MTDTITRERIRQMLGAHAFTKGLPESEIDSLAELASLREFEAGETIFEAGAEADTFYLIRSGLVALDVETGRVVPRTIQQIAEGSALGWSWLLPPFVWQFAAVARSPVRTICFNAVELRDHFEANPMCGYHVLAKVAEVMADRLHATRRQLLSVVA